MGSRGKVGVPEVGSPRGRFTGVEADQRRGRSSEVGERVGGMASGWRWRRRSVKRRGVQGAKPLC